MRRCLPVMFLIIGCIHQPILAQIQDDSTRLDVSLVGLQVDSLVYIPGDTLQLKPFLFEGSENVYVEGQLLADTLYTLDPSTGALVLVDLDQKSDVVVVYRRFPFDFDPLYQLREPITLESITDTSRLVQRFRERTREEQQESIDPFGNSKVQRSGSITRGIVAGNNRDVTLESGLRMQLAGEIIDGVQIQAVLTDENTPIQPEGTTQRLNEFDRVFIEIAAEQGTVQLGDFDLNYQESEFAQFSRKLQGIRAFGTFDATQGPGSQPVVAVDVAGATARGLFRTQEFEALDGVQGPYRLEGAGGEQFIIVVAGSEVVYLDGVQMTRGETNDYVIDYATGEVTFTANRLITSDRRISIEFQYTTNQFSRSLTGASVTTHLFRRQQGPARTSFGVTFLREADGDLFNDDFGLTSSDSLQIILAGDGLAQQSGAQAVLFDPEAPYVHYTLEVVPGANGISDTIFVAIDREPPDSVEVFRVQFTRVGNGQGSYVRLGRQVNGILYEYRGPGEGDYEPVRVLAKPTNHNVIDLQAAIRPIKGVELFGEWARSFNDQNRFSSLDSQDDVDYAYKGGIRLNEIPLDLGFSERGFVDVEAKRRSIGAFFESFNRIRPVEFGRKWNLGARTIAASREEDRAVGEQVDELVAHVFLNPRLYVRGEWGQLDLGELFEANRRSIEFGAYERAAYSLEWIQSDDTIEHEDASWFRQRARISQPLFSNRLTPGIEYEHEEREHRVAGTDSLSRISEAFTEVRPYISWVGEKAELSLQLESRNEQDWALGELRNAASAWTYQGQFELRPGAVFRTDGSVGYRVREFTDYFRENERREDTESLILLWNTQWRPFKRAIDLNTRYEASTERTPTLQEIYIRTGPELGQFVWVDDNEDGIIQIDEFLPEQTPNEGTYVQTFVPSDSLSSIISVRALVRLQLDPSRWWGRDQTGIKKILRQVSSRTTFEVQEKSREQNLAQIYLLSLSRFRDPVNTLNGRLRINQDVSLFRQVPKVGVDLRYSQLRSLSELAAGEEIRFVNTWRTEGRYTPSRRWGFKLKSEWENSRLSSESFSSRNYRIESIRIEPEVVSNISSSFSIVAGSIWARKNDDIGDREAVVWRIPLELRYRKVRRAQLTARSEIAIVNLSGDASGLAAFELTDGRGPGTSYLWGLNADLTINTYLRLTFSYDGRAPADAPTLHTLRMQLSALF